MEQQTATPVPPHADPAIDYGAEIRFGVVMYGGVSLAIYINGVANEMYEMACATPRSGVRLAPGSKAGTRDIYRRLAWLVGSPELLRRYARRIAEAARQRHDGEPQRDAWDATDTDGCLQTRLVIDVVAGTSAGGINGVFLAKALANGEQFGALKDLWVNEGDIGLLLNDKRSYKSIVPPLDKRSDKPASLLNSDRMYVKLRAAMEAMGPIAVSATPYGRTASPLVEEIDLFVTTTDIVGSAVPLRLFDKIVYERRYKQNYRFSYPNGVTAGGNDFTVANNPFLAFAARCTSAFPFAFEPMTLSAVTRLKAASASDLERWKAFFPKLPPDEVAADAHVDRAFGDGGYLDNKPFTYVVETLSKRFANVPLERKLVYVEPSPERIDPHQRPDPDNPPDALTNSIAALTRIPQYETIREDLQAVLQRNRRIERVERIVRLGEDDIERHTDPFVRLLNRDGQLPQWASLKLSDMVDIYGLAFLPYQRLRVLAVTDSLAEQLGARWGIDRNSDHQYALRAVVRVWRELNFSDEGDKQRGTSNAFLDEFDLDYRLRRLSFLLRKTDQLTRLFRRHPAVLPPVDGSTSTPPSESDIHLAKRLPLRYNPLNSELERETIADALVVLRCLKAGLIEVRVALLQAQSELGQVATDEQARHAALREPLKEVLNVVLGERSNAAEPLVLAKDDGGVTPLRLDEQGQSAASASRTLQEGVFLRAQALLTAAARAGRTELQDAVESSVDAMRVKRSLRMPAGDDPPLNRISARAWELLGSPTLAVSAEVGTDKARVRVGAAVSNTGDPARDTASMAALNSEVGEALRELLGGYHLRFDAFDQISFPLYYDTGTGEPSTVEVVRVSPRDATSLVDESKDVHPKLAGTALGNFGAFLDRRWRLNDIMWGRLDGAERLIQVLLPMNDQDTLAVRRELIALAHGRILREALVPEGHKDLTALLCKALQEMPGTAQANRLGALLAELKLGDGPARDRLGGVLTSLLSEDGLMRYVREKREGHPAPDPKATLDSAARAVTITGLVLEGISERHGKGTAAPRWLARLGLLLQGIVAVSLPGTLRHRWWTHSLKVLYAFEAVALLFALPFGSDAMRTLVITAIGVTVGVHLLTLVAGDLMRERRAWARIAVGALLVALIVLAPVGVLALSTVSLKMLVCGEAGAAQEAPGMVCAWLKGRG